jgi:hypothetical protein
MGFKNWLIHLENLAGPGGGPESKALSPEQITKITGDVIGIKRKNRVNKQDPPITGTSPLKRYLPH